ncbi:MAG: glycosyltransferase [Chloroflexi bacterium]|nr:glycosyltransferase [Chloroflexota bacterium]
MADTSPYLSVVVPCYNESENLQAGVLEEMNTYLVQQPFTWEVLISDDGSTDDSREVAAARISALPGFRLLANVHGGKPHAVWAGLQQARGQVVLFTDMDQSTPLDQFSRLKPRLDAGDDVVIGSRGMERENFPLYRRVGSAVFRSFRRVLVLPHISDTQCGFKAFKRDVACEIFPQLEVLQPQKTAKGWQVTAFDVELLYLADKAGYSISEVTVTWSNRDLAVGKQKSYWRESVHMADQVLKILTRRMRSGRKGS